LSKTPQQEPEVPERIKRLSESLSLTTCCSSNLNQDQDIEFLNPNPNLLAMTLTPVQVQALAQLRELTNGADDEEVTIGVLSSVGWDVQVCALFFSSNNCCH